MYVKEIIGYLSWPFMILVSYLAVRWALNYFEKRVAAEGIESGAAEKSSDYPE